MPDLEPITREEMLLDGEDLTPITARKCLSNESMTTRR